MNPAIKKLWVDALRSGRYTQARAALHPLTGGFCCLGVLCDLYNPDGWQPTQQGELPANTFNGVEYMFLPEAVREWAGLETNDPDVVVSDADESDYEDHQSLAELNDAGVSFARIANLIEEQL